MIKNRRKTSKGKEGGPRYFLWSILGLLSFFFWIEKSYLKQAFTFPIIANLCFASPEILIRQNRMHALLAACFSHLYLYFFIKYFEFFETVGAIFRRYKNYGKGRKGQT